MKYPFCPLGASGEMGRVNPHEDKIIPGADVKDTVPTLGNAELPFSAWGTSPMGCRTPGVMENGASRFAETTHLL